MPEGQGNSELASVKTDQFIVVPQQEFNAPGESILSTGRSITSYFCIP